MARQRSLFVRFIGSLWLAAALCVPISALAEPWPDYGRTFPTPRYELDPNADFQYDFVVNRSFPPYRDPPFEAAIDLPNPLDDAAFNAFDVIIVVNKRDSEFWGPAQTLRIYRRGQGLMYYWLVSTGRRSFETPSGYYLVSGFSSRHWSKPFDAPMLWSVFFQGGKALHSSLDREALGDLGDRPSSHGCVHIEEYRAEALFHLVGRSGFGTVPRIDPRNARQAVSARGLPIYALAPKTLVIVAPTAKYGIERSESADPEPAATEILPSEPAAVVEPEPPAPEPAPVEHLEPLF